MVRCARGRLDVGTGNRDPAFAPFHLARPACYGSGMSKPLISSADTDAMVARVAPAIVALLGDGVPRPKRAIVAALADRHPRDEVIRTLMRLAVTDRLIQLGSRYRLPTPDDTAA